MSIVLKIGILTLPLGYNYGNLLQAYALQTILQRMGHDAKVLNHRLGLSNRGLRQRIVLAFSQHNFRKFARKRINLTKEIKSSIQWNNINSFDVIIVGSDQVWRLDYVGEDIERYFLDFVNGESTKRISYAASFGIDSFVCTVKKKTVLANLLQRFDAVSVREFSGINICAKNFGVMAKQVIDPTLLLTAADYQNLIKNTPSHKNQAISYILDIDENKEKCMDILIKEYGLNLKKVNSRLHFRDFIKYYSLHLKDYMVPSIEEWLIDFMSANLVITDSFHGMVFSILFKKTFFVIANQGRGLERISSLLQSLGLEDRLFLGFEELKYAIDNKQIKIINYDIVGEKLEILRKNSFAFLSQSLT